MPRKPQTNNPEIRELFHRIERHDRGEMAPAEARAWAGLSIGQAAKLLGVDRPRLVRLEAGERDDLLRRRYEALIDTRVAWP